MSKAAIARRKKKRNAHVRTKPAPRPMSDRGVYLGLTIVGLFAVLLASLFFGVEYWGVVALGYIAAVAYLINFYTFQVYRGKHLDNWQQSLARIPLSFVGYGTKGGKPLEAAHDHDETKKALGLSVVVSLALLVILSFLMIPGLI
jgi:hypothetical protein